VLLNKAQIEMSKETRGRRERALGQKAVADKFFDEGERYLRDLRAGSDAPDPSVRVVSDRLESARCYRVAVECYQQALDVWPDMDDATRRDIDVHLDMARQRLTVLESKKAQSLPRTRHSLGR
jgi:hypothetical protein